MTGSLDSFRSSFREAESNSCHPHPAESLLCLKKPSNLVQFVGFSIHDGFAVAAQREKMVTFNLGAFPWPKGLVPSPLPLGFARRKPVPFSTPSPEIWPGLRAAGTPGYGTVALIDFLVNGDLH